MKPIQYIVFFSVVFTIYGLVNYYIYSRGVAAIPITGNSRSIFTGIFLFLSLSFIVGRFLERIWLSPVSFAFTWIGAFWLAAMAYFFLFALLSDILRLLNHLFHFYPGSGISGTDPIRRYALVFVIGIVTVMMAAGHLNALIPRVRTITLSIPKTVGLPSPLRIAVASDIHLGTIIGPKRVKRLVSKINALKPDLVLFAGDVVDEDLGPVIHQNVGDELKNIRSRNGIYSITGNHEYIGGVDRAVAFLAGQNITVLRDRVVRVLDEIYVVGREDHDQARFGGRGKKPLKELLSGVDMTKPVIVLDHQPTNLNESVECRVDLHISGHTHHGQIWPFNLITRKIYDISWGYEKRSETHLYVSSGFGTWGPPVRIGSYPEIVEFVLSFSNKN